MNILLIRPNPEKETIGLQHVMIVEPLELEVIAACIRLTDTVSIFDMILEKRAIENVISSEKPDIVCITGYITNVNTIKEICRKIKTINEKIKTVVGGVHCEVCPNDFISQFIDFRVVRNAVTNFPKLLEHIENGNELPKGVFDGKQIVKHIELPAIDFNYQIPNRKLNTLYKKKYFYIFHDKVALIKATFGCPYKCNFCFCRKITDEKYWQRDINEFVDELESIEENEIYIVDDDFLADKTYVIKFIELLKQRNIRKKYLLYGRADFIANNYQLIKSFRDWGLKTVIVGFESFFQEDLMSYDKNISVETNYTAMEILNKLNIDCYATIILSPDWNYDKFKKLWIILKKLKIHYVNLQPLTPLPGTDFKINAQKMIIDKNDFVKWDLAHVSVRPTAMTVSEYYSNIIKLYNKILFQPWVIKKYLMTIPLKMLFKVLMGSWKVRNQYINKINEAKIKYN